jgi:cytochrome b subunit of formate dehydrogenase
MLRNLTRLFAFFILGAALSLAPVRAFAQTAVPQKPVSADNDTCLACHGDKDAAPFVDNAVFKASLHGTNTCTSCHADLVGSEFPHGAPEPVQCGRCHIVAQAKFAASLHGVALAKGDKLAPQCQDCHGSHDIVSVKDVNSKVAPLNIPFVCGSCHSEGKPVQAQRVIHQDHIITNYTESIHGEGLFKKGLSVTATCVSCHDAHNILSDTDPRSTIARGNVVRTCLKCHTQIEEVHRKIIKGELWEKNPASIPVCVECHQPHTVRKVFYEQGTADADCLTCHAKPDIVASKTGASLFVDPAQPKTSAHAAVSCAQCHTEVSPSKVRACETITKKVDCAVCHNQQVEMFNKSSHGQLFKQNNPDAPGCVDCHGTHAMLSKKNVVSPTYPSNVPALCAECHKEKGKAAIRYKGDQHNITSNYTESIHGKGLLQSGLVVTAMCTSCHTAHEELPASDPASSVNPANIAQTCAQCHRGVFEKFRISVHTTGKPAGTVQLPSCNDCHTAHTIQRTDRDNFKFEMMDTCGKCHKDIAATYFDTFHGKAVKLGLLKAAKCADCHGSHDVLSVNDPSSRLSHQNIVSTCQQCHAGASKNFAGYLTHATHHDPKKHPWIFWTFWFMTALLVGTFTVSFLHTLLWLPKSLQMRRMHPPKPYDPSERLYARFPAYYRVMHALMIVSFLTLATTGMTLKFSYMKWAAVISSFLGGVEVSGFLHRSAAVLLFGIFTAHIVDLLRRKKTEFGSWKNMIFGPNTIFFTPRDGQEFIQSIRWYLGKGPRPVYGRWTYWEKFDYLAVFWGVLVIGASGLILWFPVALTRFLPGWAINVATIVHSDEALLAAGFIFTIHFFNTHFRPEKFPMDIVIFTGRMSLEELKHERPAEYADMIARNKLEERMVSPLPPHIVRWMRVFGWCALIIGLVLVVCIIYAMIFGYK